MQILLHCGTGGMLTRCATALPLLELRAYAKCQTQNSSRVKPTIKGGISKNTVVLNLPKKAENSW